jgi:hypothetical protein
MRAGFSFSYPFISLLLGQPLSIKRAMQERYKKTCPIPLLDSLLRNPKNGKNKEDMSYTSLRFSLEEP